MVSYFIDAIKDSNRIKQKCHLRGGRRGVIVGFFRFDGGDSGNISSIAAVKSAASTKLKPGTDRLDPVTRVCAVDDESHGNP